MIESLSRDDLDRVVEIEKASFSDPWSCTSFQSCLQSPDSHCWAWKKSGRVHGYLIAIACYDEMQILNIAVAPEDRGQGIGHTLMGQCIRWAADNQVKKIFLEVRASNQAAIGLYQSFSFKAIHCRKRFYDHPVEDALVMLRTVSEESRGCDSAGLDDPPG